MFDEKVEEIRAERGKDYDAPARDMERLRRRWSIALEAAGILVPGQMLPRRLVGVMMMDLKLNRQAYKHKDDNLLDLSGWAQCAMEYNNAED